jgi:hypothetical protein
MIPHIVVSLLPFPWSVAAFPPTWLYPHRTYLHSKYGSNLFPVTMVATYKTAWRHNLEEHDLNNPNIMKPTSDFDRHWSCCLYCSLCWKWSCDHNNEIQRNLDLSFTDVPFSRIHLSISVVL